MRTDELRDLGSNLVDEHLGKHDAWWIAPMAKLVTTMDRLHGAGHVQLDAEQARATLDFIGVLAKS